ncbi:efflux RND transporter periplasmic adaptor subunit [Olivibacter sp. XZL3]|uniref:efflux RND transporter periplasmic adaptor subunit n=1 Tax=Olivibacter sp. XZL3 TaxID=1735116 RepID=UPI0010656F17|nr:efflux RND transporter periplasmic adaptor subunit [Olivibacter sp. XZL3]
MNRFYIGLYGVAMSAVIACTSSKRNSEQTEEKRSVPYTQLKAVDTTLYTDYVADIEAVRNVEVRSKIQGFLDKIFVDEGALVQAGQILFKINDDEQRADVSKAQALLNNATADAKTVALELERVKALIKKNIITKTDLDVAQAQLKAAEARVQEARSDLQRAQTLLAYTSIRAPFTGRIDRIPLKVGSLLSEGALLTSVSDLHEVYAYFTISETEYLQNIARKSPENSILSKEVQLTLADGQHYPHKGKIELAESEFEEQTGTISLRARFPNPERILKHGATGKIQLPTKITESIIVPQKSVFEIQDRAYVYALDSANKVKMTNIELGTRFGHFYLIRSGLKAGQKIVFEGTQSLTDGVAIEPREVSLDSLLGSPGQGLQ